MRLFILDFGKLSEGIQRSLRSLNSTGLIKKDI
jgi:hypothetical protein